MFLCLVAWTAVIKSTYPRMLCSSHVTSLWEGYRHQVSRECHSYYFTHFVTWFLIGLYYVTWCLIGLYYVTWFLIGLYYVTWCLNGLYYVTWFLIGLYYVTWFLIGLYYVTWFLIGISLPLNHPDYRIVSFKDPDHTCIFAADLIVIGSHQKDQCPITPMFCQSSRLRLV